ncbi:MAG TPA: YcxB family protein [Pyrinomonadaceae bacterium]|jgi:Ca2+/Na+ antiporter|nr:YcxB family protein [Pyrinomonadaceae bacterium]
MDETVRLRFKYTEKEWVAATRLYITGQPGLLLRFGVAFMLLALAFVLFAAINEVVMSLFLLSMGLVLFTFVLALFFIFPRQRFRSDPKYRDEYSLEFTEEGIHFKTDQLDSRLNWSLYNRVLENESFYVLVYGKGMISVIPKRAFTAVDQETNFRSLLRRKLGPASVSRRFKELSSNDLETAYVPPAEPPDWR